MTLMGGTFPHCARAFKGAATADMPPGSPFGTNLRALALHLRFSQNIGPKRLQEALRDVFGVAIGQGGLVNTLRATDHPDERKLQAAAPEAATTASPFVENRDLELTHNGSERALRPLIRRHQSRSRIAPNVGKAMCTQVSWRGSVAVSGETRKTGPTSVSTAISVWFPA